MDENGPVELSPAQTFDAAVSLDALPLHSTDLLTVLSPDGLILYESPSIECLFGFDQDDLVGEPVASYFHPEDRAAVMTAFQEVVTAEGRRTEAIEFRHRQADGTYKWVEAIASADPTPAGNYVVNTRDISSRKERERRREQTIARLEEFAEVLSHDLRNPMTVAQGRLEMARAEAGADGDHLAAVAAAHDRMETLIDDLLALSQAGQRVSETESVHLSALCTTCWEMVATGDATIEIDTTCRVRADRTRVQQLFENLFRNAIEHAGDDVTVRVGDLDGGFFVDDDGRGIPEGDRAAVFETGYSTVEDGTGLGLSIVEQIVDAHDWQVRIADGSDGGARFEITGADSAE